MVQLAALWLTALSANTALCATEPLLQSDASVSSEGYFVLSWELPAPGPEPEIGALVLQQSASGDFSDAVNYPIDSAGSLTLTGFEDGAYYFRAGSDGNWTETVEVTVQHHALSRALGFFSLGFVLFVILCLTIYTGTRQSPGNTSVPGFSDGEST